MHRVLRRDFNETGCPGNKVKAGDSMVREEDVKQLKDVLRFFVHRTSEAGREEDPKHREEV